MLKNKVYVWLIVGLMFGLVLGMPLQGAGDVVVGLNHWSHDRGNNFLVPTNNSVDVSLDNNSLLYANLSGYAGENISWLNDQFNVAADGTSKWNLVGNVLFTKIDGNDVDVNGTIICDDLSSGNTVSTAFLNSNFVGGIDMTGDPWYMSGADWEVAQDLILDGYMLSDFLPNPTLTLDLGSGEYRWNNSYIANINCENIDVSENIVGIGDINIDGTITASAFIGTNESLWNRSGTTLYPYYDGDSVQINGSDGDILINNSNITSTESLTIGNDGDIVLCLNTLRDMYPFTDLMVNLGTVTNRFNNMFLGNVFNTTGSMEIMGNIDANLSDAYFSTVDTGQSSATQFNTVGVTYTWNMYVNATGVLTWERELT